MGDVRSVAAAAAFYSLAAVTTTYVDIRNNAFQPSTVEVAANDTVQWTNRDQIAHTVKFDHQAEGSGPIPPGRTESETFPTPGTYAYHCEIHQAMTGTVVVRAATPTSSTTTTTLARPTSTTTTTTTAPGITAPPDSTSSTTTSLLVDDTTTTTSTDVEDEAATRAADAGDSDNGDNVDGPGAVAALLLLLTAGATLVLTRGGLG